MSYFKIKSKINYFLNFCFLIVILSSCSNDKSKLANSLPENSALVIKLNSESLFSDTFLDLLKNMDLMKDAVSGPYKDVITDPSKAGIERLSDFYVFVSGKDGSNARIGGIIPLNDAEKFNDFLVQQKLTVNQVDGINSVVKGNQYAIVFDDKKAIIYFSFLGGDLLKEASTLINQKEGSSLNEIATLKDLVKSESHLTFWTNNENVFGLYQAASMLAGGMNQAADVKNELKDSYSLSYVDFKEGEVQAKVFQYLNENQLKQQKLVAKENSVKELLKVAGNENPYAWLSLSMNTKGIYETLKSYEALIGQVDDQLGGVTTIQEISSLLSGDLFVSFNGIDKQKRMVENSEFNFETGEYETKMEEEEQIKPFITASIGLNDPKKVEEKLKPFITAMTFENGMYSFNNEAFFTIKNNQLLIGSSLKSKDLLNGLNGKLNASHEKIAIGQPSALFFDIDGTASLFNDGKSDMSKFLTVISKYFDNFITDGYKVDGKTIESKFSVSFKQKENSFILLFKLVDEIKKSSTSPGV